MKSVDSLTDMARPPSLICARRAQGVDEKVEKRAYRNREDFQQRIDGLNAFLEWLNKLLTVIRESGHYVGLGNSSPRAFFVVMSF